MLKVINILASLATAGVLLPSTVRAQQPSGVQGGEIAIEEEEKKEVPYSVVQNKATEMFRRLADSTAQLAAGQSIDSPILAPEDPILKYLAGVYLFCISRSGACPFVLDAILETDLIRATQSDSITCPNMRNFWRVWLENNFEKRSEFLVQTGDMREFSRFNEQERPSYVQCVGKIREVLQSQDSRPALLKKRYADGSNTTESLDKMTKLLQMLEEQKIQVFRSTGAS